MAGWSRRGARRATLLLTGVVLAAGAGYLILGIQSDQPCNVILISLDTLRADHLGCYGYGRNTFPHIDELAGEAVIFEQVTTVMPLTAPAHASILTSLYPEEHGITSNWRDHQLFADCVTLPQIFRERGYGTVAVVEAPTLRKQIGLDRGFDSYLEPYLEGIESDRVTELCAEYIENAQEPFFLFINYFDCHGPYSPPDKFAESFLPSSPEERRRLEEVRSGLVAKGVPPGKDDVQKLEALYDGEILFVDDCVGRLLDCLRRRDLLDHTLVVITADHGEGFEHEYYFDHGDRLYQSEIHVPLIIMDPTGILPRGTRVAQAVSLLDVAPTCLELVGITPPEGQRREGRSLVPLARGETFAGSPVFSRVIYRKNTPQSKGPFLSVIQGTYKLVVPVDREKQPLRELGELYDLAGDPGEKINLCGEKPDLALKLLELIGDWVARLDKNDFNRESGTEPDEKTIERLRALGYMS